MINGRFVCYGNTPYLKNKYGDGYKITVKRAENYNGNIDKIILEVSDKAVRLLNGSEHYDTFRV